MMDATVFKNKTSENVGKFTGEIVAILREMCEDKALDEFFILVQDSLWYELPMRKCGIMSGPITIVVYCAWGKHRSKAMARILYYIIYCRDGVTVDQPIQLSSKDCGRINCPHGCCWAGGLDSPRYRQGERRDEVRVS